MPGESLILAFTTPAVTTVQDHLKEHIKFFAYDPQEVILDEVEVEMKSKNFQDWNTTFSEFKCSFLSQDYSFMDQFIPNPVDYLLCNEKFDGNRCYIVFTIGSEYFTIYYTSS